LKALCPEQESLEHTFMQKVFQETTP
jgi:hypothetical protein